MKREAKFGSLWHSWLRSNPVFASSPCELKQTQKDYIPFKAVDEHQLDALLACKSDKGFWYKISDESRGHKPFDGFFFRNSPAWIVIKFPDFFCVIDVEIYVYAMDMTERKSLTAEAARKMAAVTVDLKSSGSSKHAKLPNARSRRA